MDVIIALEQEDDALNYILGNINIQINNAIAYIIEDMPVVNRVHERREAVRNENYYEVTVALYAPDEFKDHFRMSRPTMEMILQIVANNLNPTRNPIVPVEKKLLMTIWLLAKPETFLACGDRFGVARSTTHYVFREIVEVLSAMVNQFIVWPNARQCGANAEIFREKSGGIPNVIGAIDGTHIFIKQPPGNAYDFYNRHQSHSVVLQAVCDTKRQFINISVGHPGRMHDARIFRQSRLYRDIVDDENSLIRPEQHIIGDSAYPLLQEVLTPFRNTGHLTPQQINYNNRFSRIRAVIERAFGLLKGKWRRLKFLDMADLNLVNQVITTCAVLQNIILQQEDEEDEDDYDDYDDDEVEPNIERNERQRHALGERKRNEIVNMLNRRR